MVWRKLQTMSLDDDIRNYSRMLSSSIDAKIKTDDSSLQGSIGLKLTRDRLFIWLIEPTQIILDINFKNQIEKIASSLLYPKWILKHQSGLNLAERRKSNGELEPAESARMLVFNLHYGLYERLVTPSLVSKPTLVKRGKNIGIALMKDYAYFPALVPHGAISGMTGTGKSIQLMNLLNGCYAYIRATTDENTIADGTDEIVIVDPKKDVLLHKFANKIGAKYYTQTFDGNESSFLDGVCRLLKKEVDIMRYRSERLQENPNLKFKDIFIAIDEALGAVSSAPIKQQQMYYSLVDKLCLMGRALKIHMLISSQSFIVGTRDAVCSSASRDQLGLRILLTERVTAESARFLFKSLDAETAESLLIDHDSYDASVGICCNGLDGNEIIPFKATYVEDLNL